MPPLLAYSFLFFIYVSTFRVFAFFPFEFLHQFISTAGIVIFTFYYLSEIILNLREYRITKIDLLMWMIILLIFIAAFTSNKIFGQPYYYGIMAQRSVLLSLSGVLLISFLNKGLITLRQVERSFFIISVLMLATCYFFALFVNPSTISSEEFVSYSSVRGYRYRFQFALVIMLLFYSLFKISYERKSRYLLLVFLILFYTIYFLQSRTTLVVLGISLIIYFFRILPLKRKIRTFFLYGGLICIISGVFFVIGYTSMIDRYRLLYNNVLDSFTNESSSEPSAAVRVTEYNTAIEYILKNPVLGNGFISNQWKGGYQKIFGYFYPSDIGILGNIFVYGLLGTLLIYLPYYFTMKMSKKVNSRNVFYKSCEYMLLFFFLSMFFSAVNIRDAGSIMFLVCVIYYFRYYFDHSLQDSIENIKPVDA
jgi:hypothetical protein